jgi:hypothetical protein
MINYFLVVKIDFSSYKKHCLAREENINQPPLMMNFLLRTRQVMQKLILFNQTLQNTPSPPRNIGYLSIAHCQNFLFRIVSFHVIRVNHKSPMYP